MGGVSVGPADAFDAEHAGTVVRDRLDRVAVKGRCVPSGQAQDRLGRRGGAVSRDRGGITAGHQGGDHVYDRKVSKEVDHACGRAVGSGEDLAGVGKGGAREGP
eukprot:scaffold23542_cov242-Isochrysis_galbana.AAC.5